MDTGSWSSNNGAEQHAYQPPVATYPGGPGAMPPGPPFYPVPAPRKRKGGLVAAAVIGAAVVALTAGVVGGLIGNRMAGSTASPPPAAAAPTPTAEQVKASTVDLCTRFAAGYHAMPSPQNSDADVIPSLAYITQALSDNPLADSTIRQAMTESLKLARDQASKLTNEPARGAIQPATTWTAAVANAADQKVWDLCRAYGG